MSAPSRKAPPSAAPPPASLKPRDAAILAAVLAVALALMVQSGFKRGMELMPWPDGLEYAATAVNLDQGRGAVLHFGGYSYPSRYTEGYPLILAAAYPLVGREVAKLSYTTVAIGLLAIIALYVLTLEPFGRTSAFVASLTAAVSPVFVTYSTLVLSDVPTFAVTILAAHALARATFAEQGGAAERDAAVTYWAIFGLLGGFSVMIRPTNAALLVGVVAALLAARPADFKLRERGASLAAFVVGFAPMPLWQARQNLIHLGGTFASGYGYWVPEIYGSFWRAFSAGFLLGPTMPRNPYGNLPVYLLTLCGLDGLLNSPGAPRFYLYPFAAAVFAAIGLVAVIRSAPNRAASRVVFFAMGFLASLLLIYLFYVFTEAAFILPGCFIVFTLAGYGATLANRRLAALWSKPPRSLREHSILAAVALLDLLLAVAIFGEIVNRLSVPPRQSDVVPALRALDRRIEPHSTVLSNLSLQFLELYISGPGRNFVGLHSFDPGAEFTDYHLGRLYVKQSQGWRGPVPPVLFDGAGIVAVTADSLGSELRAGRSVYLVLWLSRSPDYAEVLKDEMDRLGDRFSMEEAARAGPLALYRLRAR